MEEFVDSHCHLADEAFAGDRDEVVARARAAGAARIICIGASIPQARDSARIANAYPGFVAFTAGIHPHDAHEFEPARDIAELEKLADEGACAIGECGLDYHYDHSPRGSQLAAFDAQIALAARRALPLVVHTREAEADTMDRVREAGRAGITGVMHCFTGSHALARVALEAGWYLSFSGIVTFKKWSDDDVIRLVPDDRILVESDSPYLAPVPQRGHRNEPAWVAHTLARVAAVRGTAAADLGATVTRNANRLFSADENQSRPH